MYKFLWIVCVISLFISCKQSSQSATDNSGEFKEDTTVLIETSDEAKVESEEESFDSFFEKFINDPTFRLSRTDDPLIIYKQDEPTADYPDGYFPIEGGPEEVYITQEDWYEGIQYKIDQEKNNQRIVNLVGTESGIYVEFLFYKKGNVWFLKHTKDMSM